MLTIDQIHTIEDLLSFAVSSYGDKTFLKEKTASGIREISFAKFYEDASRVAMFLQDSLPKNEIRAGLIGSSSIGYLTCLFGTILAGGVAVPIDPQLSPKEMADNLDRADVHLCFYDAKYEKVLDTLKNTCKKITTYVCIHGDNEQVSSIIDKYSMLKPIHPDADSCACILYTSGTTGKSKGVMLSHKNLVNNAMCCENEADSSDVILSVLPIHHAYCLTCDYLLAIRYGVTVCINDSIMRIMPNIKLFEPTMMLLVPMIVETIYKKIQAAHKSKPLVPMRIVGKTVFGANLKCIYCGGAYLSPDLIRAYKKMGIPLYQGYGMTECSPRITSSSKNEPTTGDEVGFIVKDCKVRIQDNEIQVKSPSVMLGYYNNEEATRKMFTDDGWLKTGDLGYLEGRKLFLTGRKKNLIILSNGENISPEELENKFTNLDWLQDILIYAEEEQITAEIYPDPEFKDLAENLFKQYVAQLNKTLPQSKRILRLRIRNTEFDKTTSRKIKRIQSERGRLLCNGNKLSGN